MNSTQRYLAGQIAAKVFAAATFVVLARLVPKPAVGRFVSTLLFASLLAVVIDFSASQAAVRIAATEQFDAASKFLRPRVILCWFLAAVGLLGALVLRHYSLGPLVGLTVTLGALLTLNALNEGKFLGAGLGGVAAGTNVLSNGVTLGLALLIGFVARAHATAAMIVAAYALGAGAAIVMFALSARRQSKSALQRDRPLVDRARSARHSRLVGSLNLSGFLYYRADLLMLTLLAAPGTVAVYAAAYRLYEIVPIFLQLAGTARRPGAARQIASGSLGQAARETYTGMILLGLALSAPLLAVSSLAVSLLYGAGYSAARIVLVFLVPGGLGQAISISAYTCVASADTLDEHRIPLLMITIGSVPCLVAAIFVGYHLFGLPGVAFAQSVVEVLFGVALTLLVASEFKIWQGRGAWSKRRSVVGFLVGLITLAISIRFGFLSVVACAALLAAVIARRKPLLHIARTW